MTFGGISESFGSDGHSITKNIDLYVGYPTYTLDGVFGPRELDHSICSQPG